MSVNADFSTLLKCLASGKKSIEQLRPSAPRQTSALELLVVYCFRILLVYPCALYYGMLILSSALGACPTPPGSNLPQAFPNYLISLCFIRISMVDNIHVQCVQCILQMQIEFGVYGKIANFGDTVIAP